MRRHPDPTFDRLLGDPGAADPAAVAAAARRTRVGDAAGWERFWRAEGDRAVAAGDDRLAADDVAGACSALLAAAEAYGFAGHVFPPSSVSHRGNRAAQVAAFRAALPLLPCPAEAVAPDTYLFGAGGDVCALVPMPDGLPAEAGWARFGVPATGRGAGCLVVAGRVTDPVGLARGYGVRCPVVLVGWGSAAPVVTASMRAGDDVAGVVWCSADDVLPPDTRAPQRALPSTATVDAAMAWVVEVARRP
ncbi:hypothetical protein Acsp06_59760 [Actinomycetospora sp. NBRC 106375]|uniref:hypothetical protein n=1 Tax=Actinomycetospora sp. NBRC 106375 TaxID=3032207 RepID=UPI0024A217F6|nr:hypothetical protein [Actinomycetospora sp. NBRC 106375]GLZ49791.1 hypothetical protein Acsp06_59760 [Actinomycetospora sp. NBRC 106375]